MYRFSLLALYCLFSALGQILFRTGMARLQPTLSDGILAFLRGVLTNPWILIGLFFSACSILGYMSFLARHNLSLVFPLFVGLTYLMVTTGGVVVLKESVTLQQIVGIVLILAGLVVLNVNRIPQ